MSIATPSTPRSKSATIPSLNDKPLIVGGGGAARRRRRPAATSPGPSACARRCRCRGRGRCVRTPSSRRPTWPNMRASGARSATRMMSLTPLVEPLSIDEAFLDLTRLRGQSNGAGAAETLVRFARSVEAEIGVTVSVGLSYCKFLAKLASDLDKPRGFRRRFRATRRKPGLRPRASAGFWGVGRVGRERLERLGFRLIGDLQRIDEREAVSRLGEDGLRLWRLAQGRDDRAVSAERETKSVSSETTFDRDIADKAELTRVLLAQCDRVATRLRKEGSRRLRGDAQAAPGRLLASNAQPQRASDRPSSRRACSPRRARFSTPSPTASPIACLGSPRPILRRQRGRRRSRSRRSRHRRGKSPAKRRSRACATSSAPVPSSAASPFGKPRARRDPRYLSQAGVGRISSFSRRARKAKSP